MAVEGSHSGLRVLAVLEAVAAHQPIGVRPLARLLGEDKSAVQRALTTLAQAGWIRTTAEAPIRWQVTAHIFAVARTAHGSSDLRRRARPLLEQLRQDTGESALLVVPDISHFVIVDVVESRQALRMVPNLGVSIDPRRTATGRAVLPYMDAAQQTAMLGEPAGAELRKSFAATRRKGYAVSEGEPNPAATSIAAPIFEPDGRPAGAVVVTAPRERLGAALHAAVGRRVVQTAQALSVVQADATAATVAGAGRRPRAEKVR